MKGFVEAADFRGVSGWAFDPDRPDTPLEVWLVDGSDVLVRAVADEYRADLEAAGFGNGRHGFRIRLAEGLLPASRHVLRVRYAETGTDIPGSPRVVERDGDFRDVPMARLSQEYITREIAGARSARDLAPAVSFVLQQLDQLLEARASLADSGVEVEMGFEPNNALRNLIRELRSTYAPLAVKRPSKADISIILPALNQFDDVYRTLSGLSKHESRYAIETIVVDAGSEDALMLASLLMPDGVRIHRMRGRESWANAVRAGMALAGAPVVWVMDPGLVLQAGAVDTLLSHFERRADVGIISPVIADHHNRVIEAGKCLSTLGELMANATGLDVDSPSVTVTRDVEVPSHVAMAFRRSLWQRLGGFDRVYDPAGHHEADFAFRAAALGHRCIVAGHVRLASRSGLLERWRARWPEESHLRQFRDTWLSAAGEASPDAGSDAPPATFSAVEGGGATEARRASVRVARRPSVLVIDDHIPTPDQDAGSVAVVDHIIALQQLGFDVSFLPNLPSSRQEPQTRRLEDLGVLCLLAPYVRSIRDALQVLGHAPDIVYLHRYTTAVSQLEACRQLAPSARVVLNVADLHHLRFGREAALSQNADALEKAAQIERDELAAIRQVDAVIVHSVIERDLLVEKHGLSHVSVVPWSCRVGQPVTDWDERRDIAFIGSYRHHPNLDAARVLVNEVLPRLVEADADIRCRLIGSNVPEEFAGVPNVIVDGWAANLSVPLSTVRLTVAPLRFGAGLKGKILDSWGRGIPCVMTEVAAEGLPVTDFDRPFVARDIPELTASIIQLHRDTPRIREASERLRQVVAEKFSRSSVVEALQTVVGGVRAHG